MEISLDLEIPMKSLMVCDKSYYRDRWKSKEAARELDLSKLVKK